jgi:hypothetical protein
MRWKSSVVRQEVCHVVASYEKFGMQIVATVERKFVVFSDVALWIEETLDCVPD